MSGEVGAQVTPGPQVKPGGQVVTQAAQAAQVIPVAQATQAANPSIKPANASQECKTVRYKKKDDGFTNVTVTNCAKSAAGGRKPASVSPSSKKATKKKCNGSIVYVGPRGGEYVKTTDGNFVRVPKINKNDENKTKSKPKANNKKVIKKSKKLKKENNKKKI